MPKPPSSKPRQHVLLPLTPKQVTFLRALLLTHGLVCVPNTSSRCNAIRKKLDKANG